MLLKKIFKKLILIVYCFIQLQIDKVFSKDKIIRWLVWTILYIYVVTLSPVGKKYI